MESYSSATRIRVWRVSGASFISNESLDSNGKSHDNSHWGVTIMLM